MPSDRPRFYASPAVPDLRNIDAFVDQAERAGASAIHLDVADGRFDPLIRGGTDLVRAVALASELPVQVHLLAFEPERQLETLARAGANRIYLHVESTARVHSAINRAMAMGLTPSIAANPATSIVDLEEALPLVGAVLLMASDPGDGDGPPLPTLARRVFRVRRLADKWKSGVDLVVDGNLPSGQLEELASAGATSFVATNRGSGGGLDSDPGVTVDPAL